MSIVEYKLRKQDDGSMIQPWWVKDGGQHMSPIDNTMLGVAYTHGEVEYDLPPITPLTKDDVVKRQLAINAVRPATKLVDAQGNPTYERDPNAISVPLTEAEVTAEIEAWYDSYVAETAPPEGSVTQEMLDALKVERVNEAFNKMELFLEDAFVEVPIDSMNASLPFGCDKVTQENIMGINTAINGGIPVPNPTYWTPKGHSTPVQVTHTELKLIGGAILDKKNEYYQQYFTHKAVIMNAVDYSAILLYDYSTGYGS